MNIILAILPLYLVIGAGYALRRFRFLNEGGTHTLNSFVYHAALPALVLTSFWKIRWTAESFGLVGLNLVLLVAFGFLTLIIGRLLAFSRTAQAALFLSGVVGNTIYLGFPIGMSALGEANFGVFVSSATPHLVFGILFAVLAIDRLVTRAGHIKRYLADFLVNPLAISFAAGMILSLLDARGGVFDILERAFGLLGSTASPIALVGLGAFLCGTFDRTHLKLAATASVIKLIVFPLFVFVVARLLGTAELSAQASIIAAAMPTASTAFIVAEQHRLYPGATANAILASTVLSVITVPLVLLFLAK